MDEDFRARATVASLTKMFKPNGWFDICVIDALQDVWNLRFPIQTYKTMRLLHCVSYSQMPEGTREDLMRIVADAISQRVPEIDWQVTLFGPAKPVEQPSLLRRLMK